MQLFDNISFIGWALISLHPIVTTEDTGNTEDWQKVVRRSRRRRRITDQPSAIN